MPLTPLPLNRANFAHAFQLALEPRNPLLDAAAIDFELGFTRPPRPNAAGLTRQVSPHSREPRQQILQLRELDLEASFPAPGALREDVENELGAIENFTRKEVLQVAALGRRQLVVENHRGDVLVLERFLYQLRFAFADVIRRGRLLEFLGDGIDHFRAGGVRELS